MVTNPPDRITERVASPANGSDTISHQLNTLEFPTPRDVYSALQPEITGNNRTPPEEANPSAVPLVQFKYLFYKQASKQATKQSCYPVVTQRALAGRASRGFTRTARLIW